MRFLAALGSVFLLQDTPELERQLIDARSQRDVVSARKILKEFIRNELAASRSGRKPAMPPSAKPAEAPNPSDGILWNTLGPATLLHVFQRIEPLLDLSETDLKKRAAEIEEAFARAVKVTEEYTRLAPPAAPEQQNRAVTYIGLAKRIESLPESRSRQAAVEMLRDSTRNRDALVECLREWEPILQDIGKAMQLPRIRFNVDYGRPWSKSGFDDVSGLFHMFLLVEAAARVRMALNFPDRAVELLRWGWNMAADLLHEPPYVAFILGVSLSLKLRDLSESALSQFPERAADISAACSIEPRKLIAAFPRILKLEWAGMANGLKDADEFSCMGMDRIGEVKDLVLLAAREEYSRMLPTVERILAGMERPLAEAFPEAFKERESVFMSPFAGAQLSSHPHCLGHVHEVIAISILVREGARMVEVRHKEGRYPALDEKLRDPFSGKPFRSAELEGQIRIYSSGTSSTDCGGRDRRDGDAYSAGVVFRLPK
jgi:hypothetical protein